MWINRIAIDNIIVGSFLRISTITIERVWKSDKKCDIKNSSLMFIKLPKNTK